MGLRFAQTRFQVPTGGVLCVSLRLCVETSKRINRRDAEHAEEDAKIFSP